ncbi:probable DEAD-box ATP-dependent RNA helicase 48 isoform X2 [Coffea arabica]|uniref:ATP-dependent RNA helicase n=1 Tax=Coffea arabica TaxID=13443 RepID=A0A6P6U654_COFAR|nr:probable DEAD-box ATP-dependent RNA helicase 48 isoform X2 [Coffea arabica]
MHSSSIFLRRRPKPPPSLHHSLAFLRFMGGGPRTFPGGLNKWQWKRMHEKKAREKEKRLLDHEKQIYQARIRSEIRAKLSAASQKPNSVSHPDQPGPNYGPVSPQEHIKALADRFMKEGAEDLWNEADGPIRAPAPREMANKRVIGEPIDLRKLISRKSAFADNCSADESRNPKSLGDLSSTARKFSSGGALGSVGLGYNLTGYCGHGFLMNSNNWLISRRISSYTAGLMKGGLDLMCDHGSQISVNMDGLSRVRCYSVDTISNKGESFARNQRSKSKEGSDSKGSLVSSRGSGRVRWPRFHTNRNVINSSDDESDDDDYYKNDSDDEDKTAEDRRSWGNGRRNASSAALGKYDVKIKKKRVPLNALEQEDDLSQQVEMIRREVVKRSLEKQRGEGKSEEETIYSSKRFDEYDISPLTVKALNAAGYVQMTRVQEATLSTCLQGNDALVKARTGTGKSAAFLLPAIETVIKASSNSTNQRTTPVYVLILCPTRELASQIAAEATVLLKYHDGIGVQTLIGGTRFKVDQRRLESEPCQIIVATPGRLLDHIENKSGFSLRLMGLKMLILDEADHLLDLGFRKDMEKIVDCLPRKRQSLLFSATIPREVRRISLLVLKREHAYMDTVGYSLETHPKVKQSYLVAPHEQHLEIVYNLMQGHISNVPDYKVIVFCTTAMMTSLMYALLREMKMDVREIHSRKPQIYRTRISDEFKEAKRLILITSDVSARGMNYPDVTLVIQVGLPSDREQYIHRLGRTGREGKEGEGILLLAPWEDYFLDDVRDLPLEKCSSPQLDPDVNVKIEACLTKIDHGVKEAAYHAWLGYYNSIREIGRDKTTLAELANEFCKSIGLQKPPALFRKTALKMGLKDVPGIRIQK